MFFFVLFRVVSVFRGSALFVTHKASGVNVESRTTKHTNHTKQHETRILDSSIREHFGL